MPFTVIFYPYRIPSLIRIPIGPQACEGNCANIETNFILDKYFSPTFFPQDVRGTFPIDILGALEEFFSIFILQVTIENEKNFLYI